MTGPLTTTTGMTEAEKALALNQGPAVRDSVLPYGRQWVDEDDLAAVREVLFSDWLTTGPAVAEFEEACAALLGSRQAVAVNSGTAALHAALHGLGVGPGDEVIVTPLTFAASANCVVYQGATPVFADVDPDTLLLDPARVAERITPRTRAVIAVDYAGQPCDYDALRELTESRGIALIDDACHAIGGAYKGRPVGSLADLSTFSFHPVKTITTGEGGLITTDDPGLAERMRCFRNHGITADFRRREEIGSWHYEIEELGYNYRISDLQCALGKSQLKKLPEWIEKRQALARHYDRAFAERPGVQPLKTRDDVSHGYHLYVVQLDLEHLTQDRARIFAALRAEGIGVNVHYIPVHLHPYYRKRFSIGPRLCPRAEAAYERILSLPIFPRMSSGEADQVIEAMDKVLRAYGKSW